MLDKKLLEIICCPKCKGDLVYDEENWKLICKSCYLKYPIKNDIPVMQIDEAEEYNVSDEV